MDCYLNLVWGLVSPRLHTIAAFGHSTRSPTFHSKQWPPYIIKYGAKVAVLCCNNCMPVLFLSVKFKN